MKKLIVLGVVFGLPIVMTACSNSSDLPSSTTATTPSPAPTPTPTATLVPSAFGSQFAIDFAASNNTDPVTPKASDLPPVDPTANPLTN